MKYFDDLGALVAERWQEAGLDPRAFSALAMQALEQRPPSQHVEYAEVVDALLFARSVPPQSAVGDFGQPSIVVYETSGFVVEVLCWMEATTEIHQHAFSGAFHVLSGSSVHTVFDFEVGRRLDEHLELGRLETRSCELLRRGDTRPIAAGRAFIHSLFHLEEPSITVVVRTKAEPDHLPQYSYQGGIAVTPTSFTGDNVTPRLVLILAMLAKTAPEDCVRLARRIVEERPISEVYYALEWLHRSTLEEHCPLSEEAALEVIEAARRRWGDAVVDELLSAYQRLARACDLTSRRKEVRVPELRFFLALLLNVPDRSRLVGLVRAWGANDPTTTIRRWIDALAIEHSETSVELLELSLELERPLAGMTLRGLLEHTIAALLEGKREDRLRTAVRAGLPAARKEDLGLLLPVLERQLLESSLAPLFR